MWPHRWRQRLRRPDTLFLPWVSWHPWRQHRVQKPQPQRAMGVAFFIAEKHQQMVDGHSCAWKDKPCRVVTEFPGRYRLCRFCQGNWQHPRLRLVWRCRQMHRLVFFWRPRRNETNRIMLTCYLVYPCLIAFGKPAGHREVAPREFDVHSRWKPAWEQKRKERE